MHADGGHPFNQRNIQSRDRHDETTASLNQARKAMEHSSHGQERVLKKIPTQPAGKSHRSERPKSARQGSPRTLGFRLTALLTSVKQSHQRWRPQTRASHQHVKECFPQDKMWGKPAHTLLPSIAEITQPKQRAVNPEPGLDARPRSAPSRLLVVRRTVR